MSDRKGNWLGVEVIEGPAVKSSCSRNEPRTSKASQARRRRQESKPPRLQAGTFPSVS